MVASAADDLSVVGVVLSAVCVWCDVVWFGAVGSFADGVVKWNVASCSVVVSACVCGAWAVGESVGLCCV